MLKLLLDADRDWKEVLLLSVMNGSFGTYICLLVDKPLTVIFHFTLIRMREVNIRTGNLECLYFIHLFFFQTGKAEGFVVFVASSLAS